MLPIQRSGTLVIQPSPGIGDMVWHLPILRALKRRYGPLTLLTKGRARCGEWLTVDGTVHHTIYGERRFLITTLLDVMGGRFARSIILHRSYSYGLLPMLALVPERLGFGYGSQRGLLTTGPFLSPHLKKQHTIAQLKAYGAALGLDVRSSDYRPPVCAAALDRIQHRLSGLPRPFVTLGIGGSEPWKKWPLDHFSQLTRSLGKQHQGTVFICGSPAERGDALSLQSAIHGWGGKAHVWTDLSMTELFAFLSLIDLYVGNDTSLLNIAACFERPAVGLFGATPPLTYVPHLFGVECPFKDFVGPDAMAAITPQAVDAYIACNGFLTHPVEKGLSCVS